MSKPVTESWDEFLERSPITGRAVIEIMRVLPRKFKPDDMVLITVTKIEPKFIQSAAVQGKPKEE